MQKRLAQFVALMLVLACVANAQCLVSCTIVAAPGQSSPMLARGTDHTCCPHHSGSTNAPCPQTVVHGNDARIEIRNVAVLPVVPVAAVVGTIPELIPPQFRSFVHLRPADHNPPPNLPSSITILRI
jgi:hypothetical protein